MATTYTNIAYDCGQGNGKMVGPHGWAILESYAARKNKETVIGGIDGLKSQRARMTIKLPNGRAFYVGRNAHAAGSPVEALDYDRYNGVPEQRALFYGLLTEYMQKHGTTLDRIRLTIGVPLQVLAGTGSSTNVKNITDWLEGEHEWEAGNKPYQVTVIEAIVKSQATGALYQFMYDKNGHIIRERKSTLVSAKKGGGYQFVPIGILSFGFLTMEAMAVQYQKDENGNLELVKQDRFTASKPVGMHRLLEIARPSHSYTLAELDQQFRDGALDTHEAMEIYRRDVSNALIEAWGRRGWKRFGTIILVGGGSIELSQWLLRRFEGKAFLPTAPNDEKRNYLDKRGERYHSDPLYCARLISTGSQMKELNQRGRPSLSKLDIRRIVIRVALTLYEGDDDDLIDWFDSIPHRKRASFVKTALRQGGMTDTNQQEEFDDLITDDLLDDLLGAL